MLRPAHVLASLLLLLLFLLLQSSPTAGGASATPPDIVEETCRQVANDSSEANYTLCVESLRSVHRSARADLRGLAVISLRLAKANATHAKSETKALMRAAAAREWSCLEICLEMYDDAVSDLRTAARMVKARRQNDAMTYVSSAVTACDTCDDAFLESSIPSPISGMNQLLLDLTVIALGITSRLE